MFSNKLKGLYCIIGEANFLHDSFDETIKKLLNECRKTYKIN